MAECLGADSTAKAPTILWAAIVSLSVYFVCRNKSHVTRGPYLYLSREAPEQAAETQTKAWA